MFLKVALYNKAVGGLQVPVALASRAKAKGLWEVTPQQHLQDHNCPPFKGDGSSTSLFGNTLVIIQPPPQKNNVNWNRM